MRRFSGLNTRQKSFLGLLVLFVIFLLSRISKKAKENSQDWEIQEFKPGFSSPGILTGDSMNPPIRQNWMGSRYLALLPYIEAQARHETGNYTSNLSRTQNNLFGMGIPSKRNFVGSKSSGNGFMSYQNRRQSVQDLLLWMDHFKFPTSVRDSREYVEELKKRGYFTDLLPNYLGGVNRALVRMRNEGIKGFSIG